MSDSKKPKPVKRQATKADAKIRLEFTIDLFLKGYGVGQINKALQNEFKLTYEGARVWTDKAQETFIEDNPADKIKLRAKYTAMLMDLYRKSYANEHFKVCREILETAAKMGGLHNPDEAPTNSNITINYSQIPDSKDDQ